MRLLALCLVVICIFSLSVGCSVKTEEKTDLSKGNSVSEDNPSNEGENKADTTKQPRQLYESEQINLALYGATIPEKYDSKIGLVYRLMDVISNSTAITEEKKSFFTQEAWESRSLQFLIENNQSWADTMVFPGDIYILKEKMKGTLYIDLVKGEGFRYKPAILYFEAERIDGIWQYTQFKHLNILKSFDLEGNKLDPKHTKNEIVNTID